jgi:hypothetical protein
MKHLLIVTCFLVNSFAGAGEVPRKPNILLFLADDLGYADIGANGCQDIPTPQPVNGVPALKQLPDSDAMRDAAGTGQLFECIHVPGITDVREGMNGFALADINRDGRPDLIATYSPPASHRASRLAVLLNERGFRFVPHAIAIRDSTLTMDDFGPAAQIPNLADFNGDGFLDVGVTRSAAMLGGKVRGEGRPTKPPATWLAVPPCSVERCEEASSRSASRFC